MLVHVTKWGNSLGVRVPKSLAVQVGLTEGAQVEVAADERGLVITPLKPRLTLADLLKDTTPETYRQEAVDWGPDVGREQVD